MRQTKVRFSSNAAPLYIVIFLDSPLNANYNKIRLLVQRPNHLGVIQLVPAHVRVTERSISAICM